MFQTVESIDGVLVAEAASADDAKRRAYAWCAYLLLCDPRQTWRMEFRDGAIIVRPDGPIAPMAWTW